MRKEMPASVLIVEDDPSVVGELRHALELHGVTLESAGDAATAIRLLDEVSYCGLILDLVLERGGSGFEVLTHLTKANINVPTIVITAKLPEYVREMLDATRVKLVFPKPIDSRLLATVVVALCGSPA